MLVPVQYQRIVTVPANSAPVEVVLEDDLPATTGIIDPKITIFNTDDAAIDVVLKYVLDFGVTSNPLQSGTEEYTIDQGEWPAPHDGVADPVSVGVDVAQPAPIQARTSVLIPHAQPSNPVKHLLTLTNPVDVPETKTVRVVFSGYIDQTHRGAINNFRTK